MIQKIKNSHGTIFPPALVFAGYVFLVFGIISVISIWIAGMILIILGAFICFSYSGIEIDVTEKKYREYTFYFGIKSGKWMQLDRFSFLTVLCNREVYEVHSRANVTTSDSEKFYDVFMLDKLHREKLLLKRFKNAELATEYAKKISIELNMECAKYNPVLTTASKLKRYRR